MNNGCYIGRAVRDFELRRIESGKAVCSFTLAVDRPHKKDTTDFIDFVVFGQGAEYLCSYGRKGSVVSATGPLTSRKWVDKNGNNRVSWEVLCDSVALHDSKKSTEGNSSCQGQYGPQASQNPFAETEALIAKYQAQKAQQSDYAMLEDPDAQLPF
jgi:single-strand DNA-binding protein